MQGVFNLAARTAAGVLLLGAAVLSGCAGDDDGQSLSAARRRLLQVDFDQADQDDDGQVRADEEAAEIQNDFFAMEITGDGFVTMQDIDRDAQTHGRGPTGNLSDHFHFDDNGDDRIDPSEYERRVRIQFAAMDADGDESYSWEEVRDFHEDMALDGRRGTTTSSDSPFGHPVATALLAAAGIALLWSRMGKARECLVLALALTAAPVLGGPATAHGSAVYNDTDDEWDVLFTCGILCAELWSDVPARSSRSRPGQSGHYGIATQAHRDPDQVAVPRHGWSRLVPAATPSKIAWESYDDDGNLLERIRIARRPS